MAGRDPHVGGREEPCGSVMEEGGTRLTAPPRIAYLVSQYPAVSHTFILREIRELRRLGFDIRVASIRPPDRPFEKLAADEQEEQRASFYIKPAGAIAALAAHARILFARPREYFSRSEERRVGKECRSR